VNKLKHHSCVGIHVHVHVRFTANSLVQNLFWVNTVDTRNTFALFALSSYSDAVKQITRLSVDTCVV